MGRLTEDLRFFIGAFFLIVGVLLVGAGAFAPTYVEGYNLNLCTGIAFLAFAAVALTLCFRSPQK